MKYVIVIISGGVDGMAPDLWGVNQGGAADGLSPSRTQRAGGNHR